MSKAASAALRAHHEQVVAPLVHDLTPDEWAATSGCTGWRVQEVVAHMGAAFKLYVEPDAPVEGAEVPTQAEAAMEALVTPRRDWSWQDVLAEYDRYRDGALAAFDAIQEEPTASTVIPLADLGSYPMHLLAEAFCFDHWCHVHVDLLAPTGPLTRPAPPPSPELVRHGVAWMLLGLPQMCAPALAWLDRPVGLVLEGDGGGRWVVQPPAGGEGLVSVVEGGGDAAATVTSTPTDFLIWGTQRMPWRRRDARLSGDEALAARFCDSLNII